MKNTVLSKFIKSYNKLQNKNVKLIINHVVDTKNRKDIYNILNKMQRKTVSNCQNECVERERLVVENCQNDINQRERLAFEKCEEIVNDNELYYEEEFKQYQQGLNYCNNEKDKYIQLSVKESEEKNKYKKLYESLLDENEQYQEKMQYADQYIYLYNNLLSYLVYFNRTFSKNFTYYDLVKQGLINIEYAQVLLDSEYYEYFLSKFGFSNDNIDEDEFEFEDEEEKENIEQIVDEFDLSQFYDYINELNIDFAKINTIFNTVLTFVRDTSIQKFKQYYEVITELESDIEILQNENEQLRREQELIIQQNKQGATFLDSTILEQQRQIRILGDENAILRDELQRIQSSNRNIKQQ